MEEVQARLPILAALRERGFHLAFNHQVLESAYAPGCRWPTSSSSTSACCPRAAGGAGKYAGRQSRPN